MAFVTVLISSAMFGIARLWKCKETYYDYEYYGYEYPAAEKN